MEPNEVNDDKQTHHLSRLASVGQIAAGIAHEVRNPLTAVKGFLQLLQKQQPHAYLDIARAELDNAISTLQELLNVSKPDADEEPFTRFNLAVELEGLLALFQDQLYRVKLVKDFRNTDVEISGRKNQLKKAFFNVLKNAFEAIPDKGTVTVRQLRKGQYAEVSIADTGRGIPEDKLMLLGTPFFSTKPEGTGMGLTQVFAAVYQQGGTIDVQSKENEGTVFFFRFPLDLPGEKGVTQLDLAYEGGIDLKRFMELNRNRFQTLLLEETGQIRDDLEDVKTVGSIDLLSNAHKLVNLLIDDKETEIIRFAQEEGRLWAKHSTLNIAVKLEWFQAIRKVLWDFIYNFERLSDKPFTRETFFTMERQINTTLDIFLRYFFMSYTQFKDELLRSHREMINDLSVPIIPLSPHVSILPLLGTIDMHRARTIQEKVLDQIGTLKVRNLLIDMSGIAYLEEDVIRQIFKMVNGIEFMGCKTVITGLRPEIVHSMLNCEIALNGRIETKGTLQQAIEECGDLIKSSH